MYMQITDSESDPDIDTDTEGLMLSMTNLREKSHMNNNDPPEVTIYTDGGCINNPGPGGYGVVLLHKNHRKELSGGFRHTTNNRMEILAVIKGLEALQQRCRVTIYSDSQYVVNAMEKGWALRWRSNQWRRNRKEKAVNPDLWERLLEICDNHDVRFRWIRGHVGTEENERADQLAKSAATGPDQDIDTIYENISSST